MSEEKEKKKKSKDAGENVKIYARVRQLMPWEPRKVSLQIKGNKIRNHTNKTTNEYSFQKVFPIEWTNEQMFKVMVEPMIENVLNGFNAILIAYGQTGSGKTFSMLGKPHLNVIGLLPYMLKRVVETPSVTKVNLTAVEAFGHHVARIELYDLFDAVNQTPNWGEKVGNTGLEPEKATSVPIKDMDDAYQKIEYAHRGSHFAPTGKNPESSRGHVTFIASITQSDPSTHTELTSYFAMVDCAGSEGESAFTPDFIAAVDKTTLMARRLEAGCINTGLSQLQIVFNELRVKGALSEMRGNGLRRVLHPYINTRTYLSVLFTFSPSVNNSKPTESTLKFAVAAGMVKVQPVKVELSVNMDQLVHQLRRHIEENDKLIEEQNDKIMNLRAELEQLLQNAITAGELPEDYVVEAETELETEVEEESGERVHRVYSSTLAKEMTKRQEENHSTLPSKLLSQLKELDEDEDEEEVAFDEKVYVFEGEGGKLSQKDVEKEMEAALQRMQKTNRGDEMIKKAVLVDQTKSNNDKTKDAMQQLAGTLEAAKFDPSLATDPEEPLFENVTVTMDFSRMNKKELKEVCVETFDKIEKNRGEQTQLQKKQQAVVGHLVETNEWLFNTLSDILNDNKNENKEQNSSNSQLKGGKTDQKRSSVLTTNK